MISQIGDKATSGDPTQVRSPRAIVGYKKVTSPIWED